MVITLVELLYDCHIFSFGTVKIGTIYLLAGIGGNMTSCLFYPKHICVGPTSALLGLIGSMFADLVTNLTIYNNKVIFFFFFFTKMKFTILNICNWMFSN